MTVCTLVAGATASERIVAIAKLLETPGASGDTWAIILEGAHPDIEQNTGAPPPYVVNIAPACPCCDDGLVMRVTINRMLQRSPARLIISLARSEHLPHFQAFLSQAPYNQHITLTPPLSL